MTIKKIGTWLGGRDQFELTAEQWIRIGRAGNIKLDVQIRNRPIERLTAYERDIHDWMEEPRQGEKRAALSRWDHRLREIVDGVANNHDQAIPIGSGLGQLSPYNDRA
jgi:hypothetical protein